MTKIRNTLLILLTLFPVIANAVWSSPAKIDRIYTRSNGDVYVKFHGLQSNEDFCDKTGYYYLPKSMAGFDAVYSLLLATKYNESDAKVFLSGCGGSYPKIHHIVGY